MGVLPFELVGSVRVVKLLPEKYLLIPQGKSSKRYHLFAWVPGARLKSGATQRKR